MMDSSLNSTSSAVEQLDTESNLIMGLIGGALAMLVSAVIWGAITYFTQYQIGWMAIGVGFLVGFAVKFFGRGKTMIYGLSSAVLALVGCVLGNLFFYTGALALQEGIPFLEVLFFFLATPIAVIEVFSLNIELVDFLFYGLALYAGFTTALDIRRAKR